MMKIHVLNKLFLVVCFSWCFYGYSNNNPNEAIDKILTELVSEIKEVKSSYEKTNTILLKKLQDNKNKLELSNDNAEQLALLDQRAEYTKKLARSNAISFENAENAEIAVNAARQQLVMREKEKNELMYSLKRLSLNEKKLYVNTSLFIVHTIAAPHCTCKERVYCTYNEIVLLHVR